MTQQPPSEPTPSSPSNVDSSTEAKARSSGRREWLIAITAAILGVVGVPIYQKVAAAFEAGPKLEVEMTYGPYNQIPNVALTDFGYKAPLQVPSLKIDEKGVKTQVEQYQEADLDGSLLSGRGLGAASAAVFAEISVKNNGATPAADAYLYSPFPAIFLVARDKNERNGYVAKSGGKVALGELLPGKAVSVRLWFLAEPQFDLLSKKPTSEIQIFYGAGKIASMQRFGPDSLASAVVAFLGPVFWICLILGVLTGAVIALALLQSVFGFLFPGVAAKLKEAGRAS